MDYALIAMLITLCSSFLAAAAMGYLIYETLTKMGEIQTRRSQLMIMLAKNIIKQKSIRDHQNGQIKED